ncbi:putative uncharacterized protein DDB_G0267716 isoform X2 [Leptopilina heterotoma]|uniref:putative uncharacterized protein DDB_G0267716 isoform X2 n=1 Tax=Leptopilina heterotoma TaxID=63436 RepID=UPI001CAA0906|nr:putative uncharacterized protein DDB_G0267716 isoform X2 [Leptopilina heterotoma]
MIKMKYSENAQIYYGDKSLNEYLYQLVTFVGSEDDEGKKDVDIVLSKWIRFSEEENKFFTRFPSPPYDTWTMKEFNKLLKNCISAPTIWMEYEVEIENHAKTFSEAQKLFEELKAEMKKKNSKNNSDKSKKTDKNRGIFNMENLFDSMNDSLLPYVLIEKLDFVASECTTPKKNSSNEINDSQVSAVLSSPRNSRKPRSKIRQTAVQSSTLKMLDSNNIILNEKRSLRKRKNSPLENCMDFPSKKSYKSQNDNKIVNFESAISDFNGNEKSAKNFEVTVNLTMLTERELEQTNSFNFPIEESGLTVVDVHRCCSPDEEVETINSTQQSELPICNSNENENTSQNEDIDNNENAQVEESEMPVIKVSYSQMQRVESNSVESTQQSELTTCNSNEIENTTLNEDNENNENAQVEESKMTAVKISCSQMQRVESNSVASTQQSELATCNSNKSGNTSRNDDTDNDEAIFSEVITEEEKENSSLLFKRILKALNIIHLSQLDAQGSLRDIMNLSTNNDLQQSFFDKLNFILPNSSVDENKTMNNDLQQAFFAKFNLIKPISTVDEFILFDDELKSNATFKENFTQMLKSFIDSDKTLLQCVNKILNECIAVEVRAQYNATTVTKSESRIFKDTEFYKILLETIH